jgi:predicted nucleotidyltransferase
MDDGLAGDPSAPPPGDRVPEAAGADGLLSPEDLPPSPQPEVSAPPIEDILAKAVRYIKAKRGGDLAAILLTGSAARNALTAHSDVDIVVLVRGPEGGHELVRVLDRIVEIRYLGLESADDQVRTSPRLPIILRKARVLFELDAEGSHLLEQARARFRQGPPPPTIHEKIRLRTESLHWLGKAEDHQSHPALARYLFSIYLDECVSAFYRLRGLWPASPVDSLGFIGQRDRTLGDLFQEALSATDPDAQVAIGRRLADRLFGDVPAPARID